MNDLNIHLQYVEQQFLPLKRFLENKHNKI